MACFRTFLLAATLVLGAGCGGRVFRHSGAVNMDGGMRVDGDVSMDGELKTLVSIGDQSRSTPLRGSLVAGNPASGRKVAVIDLDGFLVNRNLAGLIGGGENPVALFREKVDRIIDDPTVGAVVLRVNSPGGGVTAADIIGHELGRLRTHRNLPITAVIVGVGTGGAYYAASGCDTVFAHPTSIVGGIGVILNVYNLQDTMGQFNILSSPIKAGEKIDAGTPERPIGQEEMEMLQQIADAFHDRFIRRVQSRRPQAADTAEQWSDGRVMTGPRALELGLVDRIGYVDAAIDWARQQAGMETDSGVVIFRRENDHAYTPLDSAGNQAMLPALIPLRIPGLDRSSMPTFLYMWQSDPAMASLAQP